MDSISKQKKYLSENLIVENLRMYGSNQEDIKEFLQAKSGSILAEYLNNKAWNDDSNNDTKVFLVRDKRTRKIAYYYALNCGILYKELNIDNNWAYDVVYAYRLFSIDINDTTLDFRYNLPYNIRVDNQSLIYMEVSHKGRVYYIKEDFKVYQSHIAGNGIIF